MMGMHVTVPTGLLPAERAHRWARQIQPVVPLEAFGRRFPDRQAFAALPPQMQREAALLARELKACTAFRLATGKRADDVLRCPVHEPVAIAGAHDLVQESVGAARLSEQADEADLLIETWSMPGTGACAAVDLYRLAVSRGFCPSVNCQSFVRAAKVRHDWFESPSHGPVMLSGRALRSAPPLSGKPLAGTPS